MPCCFAATAAAAAVLLLLQVTLATDLLYHWASREATATVGYDVTLRQARLQGKIDSAGLYIGERVSSIHPSSLY
jgi:hypothetical protein